MRWNSTTWRASHTTGQPKMHNLWRAFFFLTTCEFTMRVTLSAIFFFYKYELLCWQITQTLNLKKELATELDPHSNICDPIIWSPLLHPLKWYQLNIMLPWYSWTRVRFLYQQLWYINGGAFKDYKCVYSNWRFILLLSYCHIHI